MWKALLLTALVLPQTSRPTTPKVEGIYDPRPAAIETPKAPVINLDGEVVAPQNGRIERNSFVADRFMAEGQAVEYAFEAKAGELSLFALATWGYARGWQSTARIRILDEGGNELLSTTREGGPVFRKFVAFTARKDGVYRLALAAEKQMYRYTLIRHSDFRTNTIFPIAFQGRSEVHGYLKDANDCSTFRLELEAGREVALKLSNTHPLARRQKRGARASAASKVGMPQEGPTSRPTGGDVGMGRGRGPAGMGGMGRGRRGGATPDFPDLVFEVTFNGHTVAEDSHFALFTPPKTGTYTLTVRATSKGEGGLFFLERTTDVPKHTVTGYVGDEEDDPVEGVKLRFYREPDIDPIGTATTNADGEYAIDIPPGPYSVYVSQDRGFVDHVRTTIEAPRELNVVWQPRK